MRKSTAKLKESRRLRNKRRAPSEMIRFWEFYQLEHTLFYYIFCVSSALACPVWVIRVANHALILKKFIYFSWNESFMQSLTHFFQVCHFQFCNFFHKKTSEWSADTFVSQINIRRSWHALHQTVISQHESVELVLYLPEVGCYYLLRQRFVDAFLFCSLCSQEIIKSHKILHD